MCVRYRIHNNKINEWKFDNSHPFRWKLLAKVFIGRSTVIVKREVYLRLNGGGMLSNPFDQAVCQARTKHLELDYHHGHYFR